MQRVLSEQQPLEIVRSVLEAILAGLREAAGRGPLPPQQQQQQQQQQQSEPTYSLQVSFVLFLAVQSGTCFADCCKTRQLVQLAVSCPATKA